MQTDSPTNVNPQSAPTALPAAPKAGVNTSEFWLLGLILTSIQWQAADGKLDALQANAFCVVASLLYAVVRNWLKTHHTGALADLAISAMEASGDQSRVAISSALGEILKTSKPAEQVGSDRRADLSPGRLGDPSLPAPVAKAAGFIARPLATAIALISGLAVATLFALPLFLSGCTALVVKDRATGRTMLSAPSNVAVLDYQDGGTSLHAVGLDNATPTTAAWNGGNQVASTVSSGIVAGMLTHGLGTAAGSSTTKLLPAAAVSMTPHVTKPKPAATPLPIARPVPAQP